MTFMIVASPCAVVLSTMPPLLSAIANAGRHGVLAKSAVVMERLGQVDAVALDKTGTLTEGTPRVTDIRPEPGSGLDEDGLLALAAAAEHPSEHPLARAVVQAARERGLVLAEATDFTSASGAVSPQPSAATPSRSAPLPACPRRARPWERQRGAGAARTRAAPRSSSCATGTRSGCWPSPTGCAPTRGGGGRARRTDRPGPGPADRRQRACRRPAWPLRSASPTSAPACCPQDKVAAVRGWSGRGPPGAGRRRRRQRRSGPGRRAHRHRDGQCGFRPRAGDRRRRRRPRRTRHHPRRRGPRPRPAARRAEPRHRRGLHHRTGGLGLVGQLPLPLGVAGHEGSTVIVGLNGLRLLREAAWGRAAGA